MANTPQLLSSWGWPLCITGHRKMSALGRCHGDNPWESRNDVIVQGTKLVKCFVKPTGNEKEWWAPHYGVVKFLIGQFILEVTFSIRLGPLRWVPTAHCAGRWGEKLLTAVRPVEMCQHLSINSPRWYILYTHHVTWHISNKRFYTDKTTPLASITGCWFYYKSSKLV